MALYRIDNRLLVVGELIPPQNLYMSSLDSRRLDLENLLEKFRPKEKPPRNSILMLYNDFYMAKDHWLKQINSNFYEVDAKGIILHQGDSNLIEFLYKHWEENEYYDYCKLVRQYWEGSLSDEPIIEVFVKEALVARIISNSEKQRKNELLYKFQQKLPDLRPDQRIPRVLPLE